MVKSNLLTFRDIGRGVEATLSNAQTTMAGWRWDGEKLAHPSKQVLRFSPEVSAEIAAAVATVRGEEWVTVEGGRMTEADRKLKWLFF